MPIRQERIGQFLFETLSFLSQHESRSRDDILEHLDRVLEPSAEETQLGKSGRPDWVIRFLWYTVGMVKAGWITKDGRGVWAATDDGRLALDKFPNAPSLLAATDAAYRSWNESQQVPQRRAWLVRGSSVLGVNVVPEWLERDFCSVAGSQLRAIEPGIEPDELRRIATEEYAHLKHHELKAKVDEILAFVTKMNVGDLVLTTNEQNVYLGDIASEWTYEPSEGGRSNLRRGVEWRNEDAPVDFADLPAPLPARLQTGSTILDLTADLALIDTLIVPSTGDAQADAEGGRPPRHEHLPHPSVALAEELFVDLVWLTEVGELLDEQRQVIFYGPPGTGKTYIARKLAADLVGPEQVKLVQFHPAYTYEDFFEGYRPVPGVSDGTISFDLKAGPLRLLVDRARAHPDQAFVLIIDEINRANLAKVFGELYFLLEYRDQAVDLLYSAEDEGFTLPTNLYLIGTMNTADRSIALIDSAMRRRFAFVALDPDTEPTKSLLTKWSRHHGLGATAAALLAEVNRRIEDPDFRIGPSYFMKVATSDAHSPERLERLWRTSIVPLLQEHHYGEWDSVQRRYQLSSLLAAIGAGAPAPEMGATADEAEPGPAEVE